MLSRKSLLGSRERRLSPHATKSVDAPGRLSMEIDKTSGLHHTRTDAPSDVVIQNILEHRKHGNTHYSVITYIYIHT